jgi:hypothetical protein
MSDRIVKTYINIPSQSFSAYVIGDFNVSQMQSMYSSQIPGLAQMVGSAEVTTGPEGNVRHCTYAPRTGQKG